MKKYQETDKDTDSTERYFDPYPSIGSVSFLGSRWRLLQEMNDCERKAILTEQWQLELRQFYRHHSQ